MASSTVRMVQPSSSRQRGVKASGSTTRLTLPASASAAVSLPGQQRERDLRDCEREIRERERGSREKERESEEKEPTHTLKLNDFDAAAQTHCRVRG
jgi:hypothetical protein